MRLEKIGSFIGVFLCSTFVLELATLPSLAQDAIENRGKIQAVFRISKQYLHEITDKQIVAEIPFCTTVLGFRCTGTIHGEGEISVDLLDVSNQAIFSVDSHGDGYACVRGVRRLLVAEGTAWGPFSSRTLVQFDGRNFVHMSTAPCVNVRGDLHRVSGRRGRRFGAGIQAVGEHFVPRAVTQAKPIAENYLRGFVEKTADQIITRLNEKTPLEETVNRLFPQLKESVFHMSSGVHYLQAAFGPSNADVPELPDVTDRMENIRIEIWLRSSSEEAKLLEDMSHQPLAKQLVQVYLDSTLPDLAKLGDEWSVAAIGDWVVIGVRSTKSSE